MANALAVTLHAHGQEVASGQSAAVSIGADRHAARLQLYVSAVAGGPLSVSVETSVDGSTGWHEIGKFPPVGTAHETELSLDGCRGYLRVSWTLTTSASFQVAGDAHTLLATQRDLSTAIRGDLCDVADAVQIDALIKASSDAEDAISQTNPVPLTSWPASVRRRVADIAAWLVVLHRRPIPDGPDDDVKECAAKAQKWLEKVSRGHLRPPGLYPASAVEVATSSGDPDYPDNYTPRMSDNWGDF